MELKIDLITFNLTRWCSDFWLMLFQMVLRKGPCSSNYTIVINAALWNKTVWFIQSLRCPCWLKNFKQRNQTTQRTHFKLKTFIDYKHAKLSFSQYFMMESKWNTHLSCELNENINKVLIWRCRKLLNTNMQKIYWWNKRKFWILQCQFCGIKRFFALED